MDYIRIKSTKNNEAIIYNNFYYNKFRKNQQTTNFKCRELGCHASVTIYNESGSIKTPINLNHTGDHSLSPIEIDIKLAISEIKEKIVANPNQAILSFYKAKQIELSKKYKDNLDEFLKLWPYFHQLDSALYRKKKQMLHKCRQVNRNKCDE